MTDESAKKSEDEYAPSTDLVPGPLDAPQEVPSILVPDDDPERPEIPEPAPKLRRPVAVFEFATVLALIALLFIQIAQIGGRSFGIHVPPWTYELSRLLLVWMVCVGAFVSYYHGTSLSVPGRWRPRTISYEAAALLVSGVLLWAGLRFLDVQGWDVAASSLLGVPAAVGYLSVLVFAAGIAVVATTRIVGLIIRKARA